MRSATSTEEIEAMVMPEDQKAGELFDCKGSRRSAEWTAGVERKAALAAFKVIMRREKNKIKIKKIKRTQVKSWCLPSDQKR